MCVYIHKIAIYSSLQTHSKRTENFRTDFLEWFCMQIKGIIKSCLKLISNILIERTFLEARVRMRIILKIFYFYLSVPGSFRFILDIHCMDMRIFINKILQYFSNKAERKIEWRRLNCILLSHSYMQDAACRDLKWHSSHLNNNNNNRRQ